MDRIPEIMDGKNVADFVDEDIDARLALLEQEEEQLQVWEKRNRALVGLTGHCSDFVPSRYNT